MADAATLKQLYVCPRCLTEGTEQFTWAHRPNPDSANAERRTCGGNPVLAIDIREDGPLTTEDAAVSMGRTWLREQHPDEASGAILYKDAKCESHVAFFEPSDHWEASWVDGDRIKAEVAAMQNMDERRAECAAAGHTFDVVRTFQSADPLKILCSRCGEAWSVEGPEPEITSQHLATCLRNLSTATALVEQNPTPDNRARLNRHEAAAEKMLAQFVEQEGDILPPPGSDLPG